MKKISACITKTMDGDLWDTLEMLRWKKKKKNFPLWSEKMTESRVWRLCEWSHQVQISTYRTRNEFDEMLRSFFYYMEINFHHFIVSFRSRSKINFFLNIAVWCGWLLMDLAQFSQYFVFYESTVVCAVVSEQLEFEVFGDSNWKLV